jgi:antitoxin (DNA-binding transcriptional repressor) of toxin-antitoxin stability system
MHAASAANGCRRIGWSYYLEGAVEMSPESPASSRTHVGVPAIDLTSAPPLRELVAEASRKGEVVLTDGGEAVAKITPLRRVRGPRIPGSARGLVHMADDFDATPDDFRDYL